MKAIKNILKALLILLAMVSFSKCSTTKKLQNTAPFEIGEVYYQYWTAGVKGEGSGFNLFIPIESTPKNIILDSAYFRGEQSKLESMDQTLFVGRFKTDTNQKKDIIMSSDPYAEYGNKIPELSKKFPFKLNDRECIVSYKQGSTLKYYKISNIIKKESKRNLDTKPNEQ